MWKQKSRENITLKKQKNQGEEPETTATARAPSFRAKTYPRPIPWFTTARAHRCQCRFHPTWRRHIFFRVFEWEKDVRFEPAMQMWLEVAWVHKWSFKVVSFHPICRGWMGPLWNVAGIHEKSSKNGTWANCSWIRTHFWFKSLLHNNYVSFV